MKKLLTAVALALAVGGVSAQAKNGDEAASGAAAVSIIAWHCDKSKFEAVRDMAYTELQALLKNHPENEKEVFLDGFVTKMKAFAISTTSDNCASIGRLRSIANTWGFSHLIVK